MTRVTLSHLTKQFSAPTPAVDDLCLEIPAGKLTALLGPSGCGKTTILKMIAGLTEPTSGDVYFDGESILKTPAEQRGAVMVFQNHRLFPHMSVGENVAFGLKMRRVDRREIKRKVGRMLDAVQLSGFEMRKPGQLSGGQQQRVALARALVVEPRVLLLDEPLSNLDERLRDEMRDLIHDLQRQNEITTVVVTHDQEEAVMLADRLAVLFEGVLQQVDEPGAFYEQPANLEVARFFGAQNIIDGLMVGLVIHTDLGNFRVEKNHLPPGPVRLTIRPENIRILTGMTAGENTVEGIVEICSSIGERLRVKVRVMHTMLEIHANAAAGRYRRGDPLLLHLPPEKLLAFPSE